MASSCNLNFHQTFKPEKQYIGSILDVANHTESMSIAEISSYTGIPNGKSSGKVEPHILYTEFMGLVEVEKKNGTYKLARTSLGNVVYMEDPGFQENLTILLCHAMIQRNFAGADMWTAVFKKIMPRYKDGIKKELLLKELEQLFDGKANKKNLAPFLGSYEELFSNINIINMDNDSISINETVYNKEYIYLYAFVLFELWDEIYREQEEISSVQLSTIGFGKTFGWDEQKEYEVLEYLSDKGIVRLNKQLVPFTILRLVDKDIVMERLYSELC